MKTLLLTFFLLTGLNLFSQEKAGKIISYGEADSLFGSPDKILMISLTKLDDFIRLSDHLLINIVDEDIVILDKDRKALYPEEYQAKEDEVFHMYSSSVLKELLSRKQQDFISIELRKEVLTITNGNYTLEFGLLCPPYCTDD